MATQMAQHMSSKLANWLLQEMQHRDMSAREFARYTDIAHTTMNRMLSAEQDDESAYPSVAVLVKLSRATRTDLCTLISMIAPEDTLSDAEAQIIAARIRNLPPEGRAIVDDWIMGRLLNSGKKR